MTADLQVKELNLSELHRIVKTGKDRSLLTSSISKIIRSVLIRKGMMIQSAGIH